MNPVPPRISRVRGDFSSAMSLPPASASAVPAPAFRMLRLEIFIVVLLNVRRPARSAQASP